MKIRENATFVLLSEVFFDSKSISKHSLGLTPLHEAAASGHFEIANINPRTTTGLTPLHKAAANGHLKIERFSESRADICQISGGIFGKSTI